jgi:hypothetical protein
MPIFREKATYWWAVHAPVHATVHVPEAGLWGRPHPIKNKSTEEPPS